MKSLWNNFWSWYNRHLTLNTTIASFLFILQLIHLFWLTTDVVFFRLFNFKLFNFGAIPQFLIIVVDYTEIPALITTSLVYLNEHLKKPSIKAILFLIFLNIQWLHLFWITDEFVVSQFSQKSIFIPIWLAWIAIFIDYLELPVIFETLRKTFNLLRLKRA